MNKDKVLEMAKECGVLDSVLIAGEEYRYYSDEELFTFANAVIADYIAGLVPVAHIDIAKRKVILDDTFVFKTPTIAIIDDVPLYALGETK